ncbi:hypothetical protein EV426DRAFT_593801 [Tirmania nivea]|nr:hypothetical protein EV426DRAFT_593801 [Tirmania nivea]
MFAYEKENALRAGPQLQPGKAGASKMAPKTPAPKTPFRMPLDRENMETTKKGLTVKKSAFQLDPSAFVTPMGPRRIPLGGKTTNAKAPRSEQKEKLQLKLQQSPVTKTVIRDNEEETPDIEYMPPKPIDLPDIPDNFIEPDYNLIKINMFTNAYSFYLDARDENGKTKLERQMDAIFEEQEKEMLAEADGIILSKKIAPKKTVAVRRDPPTTSSKNTSRPASRVGRQTPTAIGRATPSNGARSKAPSAVSRTSVTTKSTNGASSRPTSRFGTTSRSTSRASTTEPSQTTHSRPTSAASTTSRYGTTQSTNRPTTVSPRAASGSVPLKGKTQPTKVEPKAPTRKTLEEEAEEVLREMMYADIAGDDLDNETVDLDEIKFDEDDIVFQF